MHLAGNKTTYKRAKGPVSIQRLLLRWRCDCVILLCCMLTEPTLRSRRFVTHLRNVACENDRTHQRGLAVVVFKRLIQRYCAVNTEVEWSTPKVPHSAGVVPALTLHYSRKGQISDTILSAAIPYPSCALPSAMQAGANARS